MAVIDLNDDNFTEELGKAGLAVVDFYAGWCGPCRLFKPIFRRLSEEYPTVTFFKLDGENSPVSRGTVTIENLPYFGAYKKGEFVAGASTTVEDAFREFLHTSLGVEAEASS